MSIFSPADYKSRLILNISIAVVGTGLLAALSIWLGSDISRRALSIQSQKNEIASRAEKLNSLAALKSGFETARPYISILENILPMKDQLIRLPRELEDLAKANKINFGATFGEEIASTENAPGFLAFKFSVGGSYERILSFIKSVENGHYILQFISFDISESSDGFRGSLSGKVFSR